MYQSCMQRKEKFFSGNTILDEAIMLLIFKRKEYRSDEDIQKLIRATRNMEFFRKMNDKKSNIENQLHQKLCKSMEHQFIHKVNKFKAPLLIFLNFYNYIGKSSILLKSSFRQFLYSIEGKSFNFNLKNRLRNKIRNI